MTNDNSGGKSVCAKVKYANLYITNFIHKQQSCVLKS